jgi:hypothetical protein
MDRAELVFTNCRWFACSPGKCVMKHKTSQILFAYWNEVRGSRIAPRRFDIEPARIGSILPDTFILERTEPGQHRFRLAGTRIAEIFGVEFRGLDFLSLWSPVDRQKIAEKLAVQVLRGGTAALTFDGIVADGRRARFEAVLLPLTHTGHLMDRVVGSMGCLNPPDWLGTLPLDQLALTEINVTWPDGEPQSTSPARSDRSTETDDRQVPFAPHMRGARLVRSDRRQFRVYEGGLSKTDDKL